jgi:hypothetical protein
MRPATSSAPTNSYLAFMSAPTGIGTSHVANQLKPVIGTQPRTDRAAKRMRWIWNQDTVLNPTSRPVAPIVVGQTVGRMGRQTSQLTVTRRHLAPGRDPSRSAGALYRSKGCLALQVSGPLIRRNIRVGLMASDKAPRRCGG